MHEDAATLLQLHREGPGMKWRMPDGRWTDAVEPSPCGLLCGAFNPRHAGHTRLRAAAAAWLGGPVYYELTLRNADKPVLDARTAAARCRQFEDAPLLVTRWPRFVEKSRLLPGTVFVVGVDTAARIVAERFYAHDPGVPPRAAMLSSLDEIRGSGCSFLVAARLIGERIVRLSDLTLPAGVRDLFQELPEADFRMDVSSTELRRAGEGDE